MLKKGLSTVVTTVIMILLVLVAVGVVWVVIKNIVEDTTESTVDVIASEMDLQNTKRDLRIVQSEIKKRRCKK